MLRWNFAAAAVVLAAMGIVVAAASADEPQCLYEDARLAGGQIHAFGEGDKSVSVLLGGVKFTLAGGSLTARRAVVWDRLRKVGAAVRHDVRIYAEGEVRVNGLPAVNLDGGAVLVEVRFQGRLFADGVKVARPLKDLEVHQRAVRALQRLAHPPTIAPAPPAAPAKRKAPRLIVAADGAAPTPPSVDSEPAPVTFRADEVVYEPAPDGRKTSIARGNVYLSQGNPDSDLFLELRCREAVVFGEKDRPKDSRSPLSSQVGGVKTPAGQETIAGVYLRGDVVIARGERYLRGREAYYDFTTDRAIILDPVFRTIQEQRDIPIYIRAEEARMLSARQMWFKNAKVTTSDFYTPSYAIGASRAYVMDTTPYDDEGVRLGEYSYDTKLTHTTFDIRGVPVFYWPYVREDFEQGHTALRKVQVGQHGKFGFGVETEWHLFRLLGLVRPRGFRGTVDLAWYKQAAVAGVNLRYARRQDSREYSGYWLAYGLYDSQQSDDFGEERDNIPAPQQRGRVLARHKEYIGDDWTLQFELSYICDRNFMEQYFPNEFYAGKEQETLVYAKKQRDNWAFTALMQQRMNRFLTQTESAPDLAGYLSGEPLWGDRLTLFSEAHAGLKRFRPDKAIVGAGDSRMFVRLDTRHEVDFPLQFGPVNVVPYVVGRASYWDDAPVDGAHCRPYGQVGVRALTHLWRVYDGVDSRLWDLSRLRHVITPEVTAFLADTAGVQPGDLFAMDADIEQHLPRQSGWSVGVDQRLQTKRGAGDEQRVVDWMRLNVVLGIYDGGQNSMPADGRFFWYRPEYSLARNHLNAEYLWNISDATVLMADGNYDIDSGSVRRANIGLAVQRDPRLRYYLGARWLRDLDSAVGTVGFNYKINRKYSISVFEQYDFAYNGGSNLATRFSIIRKLPRWYVGFTFIYNECTDDVGVYVTLWPEGIPESKLGISRMSLLGRSDKN